MPLIKQKNADSFLRSAVVLDLGDLRRQAGEILEEAEAERARIVAEATKTADALVATADERGYAEGRKRGLEEGRAEGRREGHEAAVAASRERFDSLAGAFGHALARWEAEFGALMLQAREDVLAFALTMGRKIVFHVAARESDVVRSQVAEALALLSRPSGVRIAVNPEDRDVVETFLPGLLDQVGICDHAAVTNDPSISRGGCIVRTEDGHIDATIEKQIDRIVHTLLPPPSDESEGAGGSADAGGGA